MARSASPAASRSSSRSEPSASRWSIHHPATSDRARLLLQLRQSASPNSPRQRARCGRRSSAGGGSARPSPGPSPGLRAAACRTASPTAGSAWPLLPRRAPGPRRAGSRLRPGSLSSRSALPQHSGQSVAARQRAEAQPGVIGHVAAGKDEHDLRWGPGALLVANDRGRIAIVWCSCFSVFCVVSTCPADGVRGRLGDGERGSGLEGQVGGAARVVPGKWRDSAGERWGWSRAHPACGQNECLFQQVTEAAVDDGLEKAGRCRSRITWTVPTTAT
ncbi:hypothetical protein SMICM304S_12030 [Streptomyces microflavus]